MPEKYISLQEVVEKLGVARGTLDYYLRQLKIERRKFPLDKRAYIAYADFERIKLLRDEAAERGKLITDQDAA
jgi:hypothetical protein